MPAEKQKAPGELETRTASISGLPLLSLGHMQRFLAARSQDSAFPRRIWACCAGSMPT